MRRRWAMVAILALAPLAAAQPGGELSEPVDPGTDLQTPGSHDPADTDAEGQNVPEVEGANDETQTPTRTAAGAAIVLVTLLVLIAAAVAILAPWLARGRRERQRL